MIITLYLTFFLNSLKLKSYDLREIQCKFWTANIKLLKPGNVKNTLTTYFEGMIRISSGIKTFLNRQTSDLATFDHRTLIT